MTSNKEKLILMAKIGAPHGIRGQVKLHSYTKIAEDITEYCPLFDKDKSREFNFTVKYVGKNLIARIDGIKNRNEAERLNGTKLYTTREKLSEKQDNDDGDMFIEDLIGLEVITSHNKERVGKVIAVHNFGAGDIIEIEFTTKASKKRKTEMFAFTKEIFPDISPDDNMISFTRPEILKAEPSEKHKNEQ